MSFVLTLCLTDFKAIFRSCQSAVEKQEEPFCCLLFCLTINKHTQTLTWQHTESCILNLALCKLGIDFGKITASAILMTCTASRTRTNLPRSEEIHQVAFLYAIPDASLEPGVFHHYSFM